MRFHIVGVCLVCLFSTAAFAQNIVLDPSFEEPDIGGGFSAIGGGGSIGPWGVGGNGVDFINDFWVAADGGQSLDMNRDSAGSVFQDLPTSPGQAYHITFSLAGNPFGFADKTLSVFWGGLNVGDFTFTQDSRTAADMGWETRQLDVIAPSPTTRLEFTSTTGAMDGSQGFTAFYGPALDNVSAVAIPEPACVTMMLSTALLAGRRRAKLPG